ncbi:MAG: right-handed parallel beta-helix repeat-containing protein [Deltaproteobacteria bacterium]|nr:right-handed parallel beta-helix repeat-containing protein [Deltaproteobacteria bacterium]
MHAASAPDPAQDPTSAAAAKPICQVQVEAGGDHLARALLEATPGTHLCLQPGVHSASLTISKSLTLHGNADGVILQGSGRDSVLRIDDDGVALRLENLILQGGSAQAGGGLAVYGRGKVQVVDCTFRDNVGGMVGGGAIYVRAGMFIAERCQFLNNRGRQGGALMFDMAMHADVLRCTFTGNRAEIAGAVRLSEAAEADIKASKFEDNRGDDGSTLRLSGTRSRVPTVRLDHCEVDGGTLINGPEIQGHITAKGCKLPTAWKGIAADGGGNTWRAAKP